MTSSTETVNKQDIIDYAARLGDDAIVIGHRLSEWVSRGPFVEEDVALGNVALDFLGHARMYYNYAAELSNEQNGTSDITEDNFAYLRDERQFQNHLLHELHKGDFAYTTARQLLIDVFNKYFLEQLKKSSDKTLAAIAVKAAKEAKYHCRRSKDWTLRLGDGTSESQEKMQLALNDIWGYSHELFEVDELEQRLVDAGIAVDCILLKADWLKEITATLEEATLMVPDQDWAVSGGRQGYHTEHLGHLLTEMQFVHRSFPGAKW
jgi:ring-1,2-phenylacetyl-CoA epoxidase subunit PaaC